MNLNQVTLPSINIEKSVAFYKKLGLHLIVDASPNYVRFELPSGDSTLSLHLVDTLPHENNITIYFENDNLDEEVRKLEEKGIQFTLLPTDQPWLWREARLKDPDGNQLILFKAGENRKSPPWRVG